MKVSLIATVKDAGDRIGVFLESVAAQSRAPDELVVVDGGSTDGTLDVLRRAEGVTLIEEPGANIARGRNVAIAAAAHDAIAVSDADCELEPRWLERLAAALEDGADVAMGFTEPIAEGFLPRVMTCLNLPDAAEVNPSTFLPSARSVAFRRSAIEAAGGYPEWLDIGEDMYVNHRWRELRLDLRFVPDAVVGWPLRTTLAGTWTQYFRYARGDAVAGMHPERHALRFGVYGGALAAWGSRRRLPRLVTLAGGAAYAAAPARRVLRRFDDPVERLWALAAIPALLAFVDAAKVAGYLAGLAAARDVRRTGAEEPPS
ncbi:MAG: glycosyltransferase [Candidatus Velamenicoccus archaeovorus]